MKLNSYHTQLLSLAGEIRDLPTKVIKGKNWSITFDDCPFYQQHVPPKYRHEKELLICAKSLESAQHVCTLVYASKCLLDAQLPGIIWLDPTLSAVIPKNQTEFARLDSPTQAYLESIKGNCFVLSGFPQAALIAARSSYRRNYQYAISKYYLSVFLVNIPWIELDPYHTIQRFAPSAFTMAHVWYAYSIVAAFSAIEELGFDVRASTKKPSMINGEWNPQVKSDLERRLRKGKIKLDEKIIWHLRGKPGKIEKERQPVESGQTPWYAGQVRDIYVDLIDAINYASWLRSKIAAHRLLEIASDLTPYDVANARHLARRLLLEHFGFWRH